MRQKGLYLSLIILFLFVCATLFSEADVSVHAERNMDDINESISYDVSRLRVDIVHTIKNKSDGRIYFLENIHGVSFKLSSNRNLIIPLYCSAEFDNTNVKNVGSICSLGFIFVYTKKVGVHDFVFYLEKNRGSMVDGNKLIHLPSLFLGVYNDK